jgi:hypothetical protein
MPMNPRIGRPEPKAAATPKTTYNLIARTPGNPVLYVKTRSADQLVVRY